MFQADQNACAAKSPQTGAAFNFWHPDLVTLHVWAWYPNPSGVFIRHEPADAPFQRRLTAIALPAGRAQILGASGTS